MSGFGSSAIMKLLGQINVRAVNVSRAVCASFRLQRDAQELNIQTGCSVRKNWKSAL